MPSWSSGHIVVNGIRVHYTRTGGDKPPLVLAHGFSDNGLCWTPVARALEGDYDVIMPDARGHGLSDAPATGYDAEDRTADLADFVRVLGLGRPALMGHSMGANTVASVVALHPHLGRCAILEDPPWREIGVAPEPPERVQQRRAEIVERKARTREELVASCRKAHPTWSEAELGPWADSKLQLSPNVLNRTLGSATPWFEVAARIACPTLLIRADPWVGAIVTERIAEEAARMSASIRVKHIAGAGHYIRREQFQQYMQVVIQFLAEN